MAKSQNPFPKDFDCSGISTNWRGEQTIVNYTAISCNGWYRLYRVGSWSYDYCYRYRDLERLFRSGQLFMRVEKQEDETQFAGLESII